MLEILKPFLNVIMKWCAIIGSILLVLFKVRLDGENKIKQQDAANIINGMEIRDKIEDVVNNSNDNSYKRMYKKWLK